MSEHDLQNEIHAMTQFLRLFFNSLILEFV